MKSTELIREIGDLGWRHDRTRGSHKVFKHSTLKGAVVIPHPKKDLPAGFVAGIRKSAKGIS